MIRLIYVETISAPGKAETEPPPNPPAPLEFLGEETIIPDRQPPIGAIADTLEQARDDLLAKLPCGATDIVEKVISAPETITVIWEAGSEYYARARAKSLIAGEHWGHSVASFRRSPRSWTLAFESFLDVGSIRLVSPGRKGFLGFGQRDPKYEVEIVRKACLEVSYALPRETVRTFGLEIKSMESLQLCMRSDNLNIEADLARSQRELQAEGRRGSLALAKLVQVCVESRSSGILQAIAAARHAAPAPELIKALKSALDADAWTMNDGMSYLTPELVSADERVIGWSDGTQARLRAEARECLEALLASPQPAEAPEPVPGSIIVACARCTKPAVFKLNDELLCSKHYHSL